VYSRTSYGPTTMEHITQIAYFLAFIDPSAKEEGNSATFALTEFYEVRNLLCSARIRSRLRSISAVSPSGSESP